MLKLPDKKFPVIYADVPWRYNSGAGARGAADKHYKTMSTDEICMFPIDKIAADDCALFCWATLPMLEDFFRVLFCWGFKYKNCAFMWVKTNKRFNPNQQTFLPEDFFYYDDFMGQGHWTRGNAEPCFLATRGNPKSVSKSVRQIVFAPIQKHSQKPEEVMNRISTLCGDVDKIELFARKRFIGWHSWGDQLP